ncbi:MAG: OmpA family protein [Anderseniella sp.]
MAGRVFQTGFAFLFVVVAVMASTAAYAQNRGPFKAHPGMKITTAFASSFGPDAESSTTVTNVDPGGVDLSYSSSRGVVSVRRVQAVDMMNANTFMMGYSNNLPKVIPNTTSTGLSANALEQLRSTGSVPFSLVYDASLARIDGRLNLVKKVKFPVLVENQLVSFNALYVTGTFSDGRSRQGNVEFYIYDDRGSPAMFQSTVNFNWEKTPRTERIVRVTAGASQRSAMEQTLKTIRKVDLYGIHFDFDKATIRPEAASTVADIAETLRVNPGWRLMINGHTDSIGKESYNLKLSQRRAASVKAMLVNTHGVSPDRLETQGFGSSVRKGRNDTLQGRKLNRRVELVRIDR